MKKILPVLLVIPSILLIGFGVFKYLVISDSINTTSTSPRKSESRSESTLNNTSVSKNEVYKPEVKGETTKIETSEVFPEYPEVKVCYKKDCKRISKSTVEWMFENDEKKNLRINKYFDSHIVPYFNDKYFKKTITQNSKGVFTHYVNNTIPNLEQGKKNYLKIVKNIKVGSSPSAVELYEIDSPGTDGKFAGKYIEVDNSKQKLYAWKNGKVDKVIELSGPRDGYEVYGIYPIIDKGIEPAAPGGLYMPYWMAFYYAPNQKSWYGLHGLIWWYEGDSKKVYEPLSNIGVRRSAGCIRMLKEDAKYLYDNYNKGDLLLIHE